MKCKIFGCSYTRKMPLFLKCLNIFFKNVALVLHLVIIYVTCGYITTSNIMLNRSVVQIKFLCVHLIL